MKKTIKLSEIIYDKNNYPRQDKTDEQINLYRQASDLLPPIVVSKNKKLVDGYHRLIVYRLEGKEEIEVEVLEDISEDIDIYFEAVVRNAIHGLQLTRTEKRNAAIRFYKEKKITQEEIAKILSVSQQTVSNFVSEEEKAEREKRNMMIIDLYLKCYTEDEIIEQLIKSGYGLRASQVNAIIKDNDILTKFSKIVTTFDMEHWTPERSNAWKQFRLDKGQLKFKGQLPKELMRNVIYYYSGYRDIVIDPMAGSGTTGAVCKEMGRRYKQYDINPILDEIEENDVLKGMPKLKINKLADLIIFDPWYFSLLKEDVPESEFTESYEGFKNAVRIAIGNCSSVLKKGGRLILFMKPMREKLYEGKWLPSSRDCSILIEDLGYELIQEISAPLSFHEVFSSNQVKEAEKRKVLLNVVNHVLAFERL